jgi:hypothetical protein
MSGSIGDYQCVRNRRIRDGSAGPRSRCIARVLSEHPVSGSRSSNVFREKRRNGGVVWLLVDVW